MKWNVEYEVLERIINLAANNREFMLLKSYSTVYAYHLY